MDLLVLDTIHGGKEIGDALVAKGHHVDMVDVYHGAGSDGSLSLESSSYDRVIAPVHLDPDHPVLKKLQNTPRISHHEAVKWILGENLPSALVEITGAQGKTTTAHAIAHILPGCGILHTSRGTFRYPEKEKLFQRSITPASLLLAVNLARELGGWLVAEESLGVTGAGDLVVITSDLDYRCAAGKKSAFAIKMDSSLRARRILVAPGVYSSRPDTVHADTVVRIDGNRSDYNYNGIVGSFENGSYDTVAQAGRNLRTYLDMDVQVLAEQLMANKLGAVVAIEPSTGGIIAMASGPTYDPNLLTGSRRRRNFSYLLSDTARPLFNRAIKGQYPPGSTIKPMGAMIALDEGVITPEFGLGCGGAYMGCRRPIKCTHAGGGHAANLRLAMANSCNSYFCHIYRLAVDNPAYGNVKDGYLKWKEYANSFGMGVRLG
ncbi:MAG: penicillin-binding transpeptidase domain-containing protein, partial [Methanoregulaceae archaeon]|nr:penicillin-binding transpeptidase domain-containing protein [Methanoregulaceae archaeon]